MMSQQMFLAIKTFPTLDEVNHNFFSFCNSKQRYSYIFSYILIHLSK